MRIIALTVFGWMVATATMADPGATGKPEAACEKQAAQCMKQCDKEKRMWFFKGEAYESCAARCDARGNECAATGMEEDGDHSMDRMRDRDTKGDKKDAAEASDEVAAEADEAEEAMEEAGEDAAEAEDDARERPRGKDKKGGKGSDE